MTATISPAAQRDLDDIRRLMSEYGETLDVRDRCFQRMDDELAGLPGAYAPPGGALLIARDHSGEAVGCIAMRSHHGFAEMKRLYVRPAGQGQGLGRRLAEAIVEAARASGAKTLRLDTLATMQAAQSLYRAMGFREIAPYNSNPTPGITYFELEL